MGFIYELLTGTIELDLLAPSEATFVDQADILDHSEEEHGIKCTCGNVLDPRETTCTECFREVIPTFPRQIETPCVEITSSQFKPQAPSAASFTLAKLLVQWWHLVNGLDQLSKGQMITPGSIEAYSLLRIMVDAVPKNAEQFPAYPLNDQTQDLLAGRRGLSCNYGPGYAFMRKLVNCCHESLNTFKAADHQWVFEIKHQNEARHNLITYPVTSNCGQRTRQLKPVEGQLQQEECQAFASKPLSSFQSSNQGLLDRYCTKSKTKPAHLGDFRGPCENLFHHPCAQAYKARGIVEVTVAVCLTMHSLLCVIEMKLSCGDNARR